MIDYETQRQRNELQADKARAEQRHRQYMQAQADTRETILKASTSLLRFLDGKTTKTEIVNQLKEIGTPDALKVVQAVNDLHQTIKTHENTDLSPVVDVLKDVLAQVKDIPKDHNDIVIPEQVTIKNQIDLRAELKDLLKAVQAIKLVAEAPVVNVPETKIDVAAPDLKPLSKDMQAVEKAVKSLVFPEYKTDNSGVEKLLKKTNKTLGELLDKPTGGGGSGSAWTAVGPDGIPMPLNLTADGKLEVNANVTVPPVTTTQFDPTENYKITDTDTSTTTKYYGFTDKDGNWYILQENTTAGTYRYIKGASDYTTNWTGRTGLTYDYFYNTF